MADVDNVNSETSTNCAAAPMRDWSPFRAAQPDEKVPGPRKIGSTNGVGDRLRVAAFAELQAREGFRWALDNILDAPQHLKEQWKHMIDEEDRHYNWLLGRMQELKIDPAERPVSDSLWRSVVKTRNANEFVYIMADAEELGKDAEQHFVTQLRERDPQTAEVFARIAAEEEHHISAQRSAVATPAAATADTGRTESVAAETAAGL